MTLSELNDRTGLPACFIEELLRNDFRPDTSWSNDLPTWQDGPQLIHTVEILETSVPIPRDIKVNVCLWTTVQFYQDNPFRDVVRVRIDPRTWPRISFVESLGDLWEVVSGSVYRLHGRWRWSWHCYRNTELARHFRGVCGDELHCRPCAQIDFLKKNSPVIPRHQCGQDVEAQTGGASS